VQAAAGVAGIIKMVMAMRHGVLPKTLHVDRPSPHIDWSSGHVSLLTEPVPWPETGRPRRAAVSSFGLSGTNAHLIVEEAPRAADRPDGVAPQRAVMPWLLSARTAGALRAQARRLRDHLLDCPSLDLADAAYTLAAGRAALRHRAVVVGGGRDRVLAGLEAIARGEPAADTVTGDTGTASTGTGNTGGEAAATTVFVLPGRSDSWPGLGLGLLQASEVFAARLRDCASAVAAHTGWDLVGALRGLDGAPAIDSPPVARAGTFAVAVSVAALWRSAGVEPDAVIGHGEGEIAAACVAGALSLDDAVQALVAEPPADQRPDDGQEKFAHAARELALSGPEAGTTVFVEVGPEAALAERIREALAGTDSGHCHVVSSPGGTGLDGFLRSVAELHVHGGTVTWPAVLFGAEPRRVELPTYHFDRERYWLSAEGGLAAGGPWRLAHTADGSLGAEPCAELARPLGQGEVRVALRGGGLTFRDVIVGLGLVSDARPPGGEGAGVVAEVGPGVTGLAPGDRVAGLLTAGIGPLTITDYRLLRTVPGDCSLEDAAGVPIAFLTAYHALVNLARVTADDRVLIHAAAGGVGMAALQLARHLKAEVYATASPSKWETLHGLGVPPDHLASSRSAQFADDFLAATGGRGMDVVINCLAGPLVDASLRLLPRGGRFIELGKTDIRSSGEVAADHQGVTYAAFDVFDPGPDRLGMMLADLHELFADGTLRPLPVTAFDVNRAGEAFRHLALARHTGKVVLRISGSSHPPGAPNLGRLTPPPVLGRPRSMGGAQSAGADQEDVLTLVRRQAAIVLSHDSPEAIEAEQTFEDLGFESLTAVELRNRLSTATGLRLPPGLVFDHPTPSALARHLRSLLTSDAEPVTAPLTAQLDELEKTLADLDSGSPAWRTARERMRAMLRQSSNHQGGLRVDLQSATDDEIFAEIDDDGTG
jgi:NADPH:quinone reductase-like Zn-dependent oxidoreductase/acyl carrier protein